MTGVRIDMDIPFPTACGRKCIFCHYRLADDLYHCVFFRSDLDTALINECVDNRTKYKECPVKRDR